MLTIKLNLKNDWKVSYIHTYMLLFKEYICLWSWKFYIAPLSTTFPKKLKSSLNYNSEKTGFYVTVSFKRITLSIVAMYEMYRLFKLYTISWHFLYLRFMNVMLSSILKPIVFKSKLHFCLKENWLFHNLCELLGKLCLVLFSIIVYTC